ncbi:MAG: hypothetical protein ACREMV_06795, partial [Gemmatimonadales bacterium]
MSVLVRALCALLLTSRAVSGQDSRLAARLDSATARAVSAVVEQARSAGLPTEPLVAKALEGASKGAPGGRIVGAVTEYAAALGAADARLGAGATDPEVVAGAAVLLAGAPPAALGAVRAGRPRQSVTVPLVVLADLLTRGVPVEQATTAVIAVARAGVPDAGFL